MYQDHMPENNGFDENFGGDHSANQGRRFLFPAFRNFPRLADKGTEEDCLTDVLTDCAVDFLERKKNDPFFLYLSYYTVHSPITGKPAYVKKYEQKLADNPDADYYMNSPGKAAMIQSLDESVGRVMAKLKEIDQLDNTLIIFTGDNGSQGNEFVVNYRGNKGTAYEGGTRVPLIVAGPRIQTGVSDVPTIAMDLYPTILSYINAPPKPKEHLDGVDIMPVLTGTGTIEDRPLYWHYPHYDETIPYSSAIVDGWKVIRYPDDGKVELYNLNDDPMEQVDLAATKPEKAKSMVRTLDEYLSAVDAQPALPNPDYDPTAFSGGIRDFRIWDQGQKKADGGFHTHQIWSPHQAGKTRLRILLPDDFDLRKKYRVLYVLPVHEDGVGQTRRRIGRDQETWLSQSASVDLRRARLHEQAVVRGSRFESEEARRKSLVENGDSVHRKTLPGADRCQRSTVDRLQQIRLGRRRRCYCATQTCFIALPLGIRASASTPGRSKKPNEQSGSPANGDRVENFEANRLSNLIKTRGKELGDEARLFYFNTEGTRAIGGVEIHRLLVEHEIPHRYVMEPHRKHAWDSGWIPEAMAFLVGKETTHEAGAEAGLKHPF